MDVTKYAKDGSYGFKTEKVPKGNINLNDNSEDTICLEFYRKRMIGKNKPISSVLYNGTKEIKEDGAYFKTNLDDEFCINQLDTSLNDIRELIQDVKKSGGIYGYFENSRNKEVTVNFLGKDDNGELVIHEIEGTFRFASYLGYICMDCYNHNDMIFDFDSIYSIQGEDINYVNPFAFHSKINYEEYFSLIEDSAFGKEKTYSLKRKK
jgi:hypothetical protein